MCIHRGNLDRFETPQHKMASQSSRLAVSVSTPQRARRIPDEEWEIWREELVKLFIEENLPRKEIVTVMAEKHHFIIT